MSNTIITIEIATVLKAALVAVVPANVEAYGRANAVTLAVDGVLDAATESEDAVSMPCVVAVVNECLPQQYRSVLRAFPVVIEAATWYPDDVAQIVLYTIGQAVSQWLAEPSLTLTLAHFDALTIDGPPERGNDGRVQFMRWTGQVLTRKAT